MTYITRADLNRKWGARNITAWAKREGSMTAAQVGANVDAAIASAEAEINAAFTGSIYAVPLVETVAGGLSPLKEAMIDMAAAILAPDDERESLVDSEGFSPVQRARNMINMILCGARVLSCTRNTAVAGWSTPRVISDDVGYPQSIYPE